MRLSSVPLFEIDLGAVVSLFLLGIALPGLIRLSVRTLIGLVAGNCRAKCRRTGGMKLLQAAKAFVTEMKSFFNAKSTRAT